MLCRIGTLSSVGEVTPQNLQLHVITKCLADRNAAAGYREKERVFVIHKDGECMCLEPVRKYLSEDLKVDHRMNQDCWP